MTHSFPTRRSSDLLGAIAVLEAEQQRPAGLVVAHHRTRPLERRRLGEAGAALIILAREAVSVAVGIEGEGKSAAPARSEEHTSELQSLMRISYAVFCLKKKNTSQESSIHKS